MPRRYSGFLSKTEKKYLEFLEYGERYGHEINNRATWDEEERMPHRSLDHYIRMKTRQGFRDLRLVFEKFGYIELQQLSNDSEVLSNMRFVIEKVNLLKAQRGLRRLRREIG